MRAFITGATGFIGSRAASELVQAGHAVTGLARSQSGAAFLAGLGVEALPGSIEDLDSLRRGASQADAVVHCAFNHDFSKFKENCEADRLAIEALGSALEGTGKTLLVSAGVLAMATDPLRPLQEVDDIALPTPRVSEQAARAFEAKGVKVLVMRLSQIHDRERQGLVSFMIRAAQEKGVSAYIGEGKGRWAAAHVMDAARLYRLALEKADASCRLHAVGEEGVPMKDIAEAVGKALKVPVVSLEPEAAREHFRLIGAFAGADAPASSALTRSRFGWEPSGPGLIEDLENLILA